MTGDALVDTRRASLKNGWVFCYLGVLFYIYWDFRNLGNPLFKVLVPPPPQFPQMTWNGSQNMEMGLEMMWCAYFQILKKGVITPISYRPKTNKWILLLSGSNFLFLWGDNRNRIFFWENFSQSVQMIFLLNAIWRHLWILVLHFWKSSFKRHSTTIYFY